VNAQTPWKSQDDAERAARLLDAYRKITEEVGKIIVGQRAVIEQLMIAILARGHCLLEGVPGLAKTLMVRCLSEAMDLSFRRIQFTPDLMPADITGTDIIQEDPVTGRRRLTRSPWAAPPTTWRSLSSSSPPRTRSSRKALIRFPRLREIAFSSMSRSTIPTARKNGGSSIARPRPSKRNSIPYRLRSGYGQAEPARKSGSLSVRRGVDRVGAGPPRLPVPGSGRESSGDPSRAVPCHGVRHKSVGPPRLEAPHCAHLQCGSRGAHGRRHRRPDPGRASGDEGKQGSLMRGSPMRDSRVRDETGDGFESKAAGLEP